MKTNLQDYFYYSKTQRNGFVIVICLIMLFFLLPRVLDNFIAKPATDFSAFQEELIAFEAETAALAKKDATNNLLKVPSKDLNTATPLFSFDPNSVTKEELIKLGIQPSAANTFIKYRNTGAKFYKKEDVKKVYGITNTDYNRLAPYIIFNQKTRKTKDTDQPKNFTKSPPKPLTPFIFNPNDANKETFLKLGLSKKVTQTILNFRSKGGQFWKKQDFQKIYGLTDKDYLTLAPYIEIPSTKTPITQKTNIPAHLPQNFSTPTTVKVDINNSNVEDWKQLSGIGDITAKRIVNFRDKLGGFTSVEQIKMTYNVPDSVIEKVATQLIVSPIPNRILINTISAEDLKLHPYIKTKQAYSIINYRVNHGTYQSIEDLYKVKALKPELIERIQPYLSFETSNITND